MVELDVKIGAKELYDYMLRHTYTSNLLSGGAKPTDVQELLGHSDVNTTMSIYAHATREAAWAHLWWSAHFRPDSGCS